MTMLQLAGPAAETAFRISKLREQLQSCSGAVRAVSVHFLHFVHTERPLGASEREVLDALLTYGTPAEAVRRRNLDRTEAWDHLTVGVQGDRYRP